MSAARRLGKHQNSSRVYFASFEPIARPSDIILTDLMIGFTGGQDGDIFRIWHSSPCLMLLVQTDQLISRRVNIEIFAVI